MGLLTVHRKVAEHLKITNVSALVEFGRRRRSYQVNQGTGGANRVIFSPGDASGKLGKIEGTEHPGRRAAADNARELASATGILVVYVWAVAPDRDVTDEEAQWDAVLDLQEHVIRAVHAVAGRWHAWGDWGLAPNPQEHVYGVELISSLTIRFPFLSAPPVIDRDVVGEVNKHFGPLDY